MTTAWTPADRALLLQLAGERLETAVAEVEAEGWKWVKAEIERDYTLSYGRVYPSRQEGEDDAPVYSPDDLARAGAIIRIDRDGALEVARGLVHPDDVVREIETAPARCKAVPGDLPAALVEELTAHRTVALRLELSRRPGVALAATVHALALSLLYRQRGLAQTCLELTASSEELDRHIQEAGDCTAHVEWQREAERWGDLLPDDPADLFAWCLVQSQEILVDLLAYLAALTANAVEVKAGGHRSPRLEHADALARTMAFDMAVHWTPSIKGFYGRVNKATLLHIAGEAKASLPVNISGIKKAEAARYVAQAMNGRTWLPKLLN